MLKLKLTRAVHWKHRFTKYVRIQSLKICYGWGWQITIDNFITTLSSKCISMGKVQFPGMFDNASISILILTASLSKLLCWYNFIRYSSARWQGNVQWHQTLFTYDFHGSLLPINYRVHSLQEGHPQNGWHSTVQHMELQNGSKWTQPNLAL